MQNIKNKLLYFLRSSESIFRVDMLYLTKGGVWTTLRFIIGTLTSIVTVVAYGNLLPREIYGTYNYLLSLGAALSFLTFSGTGTAVMRAVARGYENVVPEALRVYLKYNLIAVATVLAAAIYYGYKGNWLFAFSLAMLSLAYPVAEAYHLYVQVLTGKKRFDIQTKVTSITAVVSAVVTVVALLLTQNILILVSVYSIVSLLTNMIAYSLTTKNLDKSEPNPEQMKEMKHTSLHLTGAGIIGVIASYIDRIVLFQVAGPAALAVYGLAIAGPDRLKSLIKNLGGIAMPNLAQRSLHQIRQMVYRRIGFSIFIGTVLFLVYFLLAPAFFKLLLPKYLDAIIYSQVQALSLIVVPVSIYIGGIFASQNMLRAFYALNIGSHVFRILLFVSFGLLWQIWGLIFASLLFSLLNALYGIIIWEIEVRRLLKKV